MRYCEATVYVGSIEYRCELPEYHPKRRHTYYLGGNKDAEITWEDELS